MDSTASFDHLPNDKKQQLILRAEKLLRKDMPPQHLSDDDLALCLWYSRLKMPQLFEPSLPDDVEMLPQYLQMVAWFAEVKQEWVRRRRLWQ